jgi:PEP-CTERM motif
MKQYLGTRRCSGTARKELPYILLKFSVVFACLLFVSAVEVRADGYTITVSVGDDPANSTPSIEITGSSSAASIVYDNCGTQGCTIIEAPNPGFFAVTPIPPNFYIADQGPNPIVSDWFQFILDPSTGDVVIGFSDAPPIDPLCIDVNCQAVEGSGKLLNVGTIMWSDPVADTVQFQFNSATVPTPEPASLLLLGIGLAGAGVVRRKRQNLVLP